MNTKLDEMKEDLQKWESELNDLIAMRNMIMSSPNLNHIDLTKTNEIIKRKEDTINEAKLIEIHEEKIIFLYHEEKQEIFLDNKKSLEGNEGVEI